MEDAAEMAVLFTWVFWLSLAVFVVLLIVAAYYTSMDWGGPVVVMLALVCLAVAVVLLAAIGVSRCHEALQADRQTQAQAWLTERGVDVELTDDEAEAITAIAERSE